MKPYQNTENKKHPAAEWAETQVFSASDIDCTIAVVLKILDNKCKMLPGEKAAILEIYDVVRSNPGLLFDEATHNVIQDARFQVNENVLKTIHGLRVLAEQQIPKPIMKRFKSMLRTGLFGE